MRAVFNVMPWTSSPVCRTLPGTYWVFNIFAQQKLNDWIHDGSMPPRRKNDSNVESQGKVFSSLRARGWPARPDPSTATHSPLLKHSQRLLWPFIPIANKSVQKPCTIKRQDVRGSWCAPPAPPRTDFTRSCTQHLPQPSLLPVLENVPALPLPEVTALCSTINPGLSRPLVETPTHEPTSLASN